MPGTSSEPAGRDEPEKRAPPKPVLREIERPVEETEPETSADHLEILWGDNKRFVADLGEQIPTGVRALLDGILREADPSSVPNPDEP